MKFNYPSLTPGYVGIKTKKLTLNSRFYAELFNINEAFNGVIVFPQRVVKKEFFDEIITLEDNNVKAIIKKHRKTLCKGLIYSLKEMSKHNQYTQKIALNWMNLLLRYGLAEKICMISEHILMENMSMDHFFEAKFIREIALFQSSYFNTKNVTQGSLVNFVKNVLITKNLPERIKMLALNFFIVTIYRFGMKVDSSNLLEESCIALELLAKEASINDFGDKIRVSVAYRGLAMLADAGKSKQDWFLKEAELIARDINANNTLEELVFKENLYTCLQSLAKWNICHNRLDSAYSNFVEMIALDPFDSIAYAEMGFFLLQQNNFKEASPYFKKAISLGPPAVGMHAYYYAKCLQELGRKDAIQYLYKATELDKEAISPWLDIIDYYLSKKETVKLKITVKHILKSQRYRDQLEENEYESLKNMLRLNFL